MTKSLDQLEKELTEEQLISIRDNVNNKGGLINYDRLEANAENMKIVEDFFGKPFTKVKHIRDGLLCKCFYNSVQHKNPYYGVILSDNEFVIHAWNVEGDTVMEHSPGWENWKPVYYGRPVDLSGMKEIKFMNLDWPEFIKKEIVEKNGKR